MKHERKASPDSLQGRKKLPKQAKPKEQYRMYSPKSKNTLKEEPSVYKKLEP